MTGPDVSRDAERAVLGAVLLAGGPVLEPLLAEHGLRDRHFRDDQHRTVFQAAVALHDRDASIDTLTVAAELERTGRLADAGGRAGVDALTAAPHDPAHAADYAATVIEHARWRARAALNVAERDAIERRDEAAYQACRVSDGGEPDRAQALTADLLVARWDALQGSDDRVIPTPWPVMNEALFGGGRPGDTTVMAAHSSHGKSLCAAAWLEHIGDQGGRVGLYTNEMAVDDIVARFVAGRTSVGFEQIMRRNLTDQQAGEVRAAISALPVVIVPAYGWPWLDIARHLRRMRWDLACLDLFNRLPGRDRINDVDAAIGGLCNAAAQSDAHLIVAAQLNQERSKTAERPRPTGRDLRESGSLYNDPANVVFVHQEQDVDPDTGAVDRTGVADLWLDKARNGRPGAASTTKLTLNPYRMRFEHGDDWRGRRHLKEAA